MVLLTFGGLYNLSWHLALNQILIIGNLLLSRFVLNISEFMYIEKKKLDFFYFDDMFVLSSVFVLFSQFVLYISELKCIEKKKLVFFFPPILIIIFVLSSVFVLSLGLLCIFLGLLCIFLNLIVYF